MVRHVLLDADDAAIRMLADSVTIPTTSIKGFTESADLARLLTPDWTPDPPEVLMATTLRPAAVRIDSSYRIAVKRGRDVAYARVMTAAGAVAARGQVAVTGETCVFDQIATAPGHRRRGLGTAVMAALTTAAMDLGAVTGILGATLQGRALYEALGWAVAGPLSSFVYKRGDASPSELDRAEIPVNGGLRGGTDHRRAHRTAGIRRRLVDPSIEVGPGHQPFARESLG